MEAKADLYDLATRFFQFLARSPAHKEQLRELDRVVQFEPSNGRPFYVEIKQGKIILGRGQKYGPDLEAGLYIKGEASALYALFQGELTLAEAIYQHKIRIPGYRNREPIMVWFSRLLRQGLGIRD